MPPLPPVPQVLKCALSGTDSGDFPWANVFHLQYAGGAPSSSDLSNFAQSMLGVWSTFMAPLVHSSASLAEVTITDLTSADSGEGSYANPTPGTRTGNLIPGSAAFLISYPGAGPRYRGGHPRQYLLCGVQADLQDEAHWTSTFRVDAQGGWATFCENQLGTTVGPCTITSQVAVSYYTTDYTTIPHTRIRRTTPEIYTIENRVGNQQLASQRRRIGRKRR